MKYYLDTEFDGLGGPLISLALVREDGESFYAVTGHVAQDPWVRANVKPILYSVPVDAKIQGWYDDGYERGFKYFLVLGEHVAEFLKGDPHPHIVSDWPDDIKYFCQAIITGPGEMVDIPAATFEVARVDAYPTTLKSAVQHNAWWDAMALRHRLTCSNCGAQPVREVLDGDPLCQHCCDAWAFHERTTDAQANGYDL